MNVPAHYSDAQAIEGLIAIEIIGDIADELSDETYLDILLSEPTDEEENAAEWAEYHAMTRPFTDEG
jgi:hypothetical protein